MIPLRKGNKGEWSELYTFLKILSEGELYAADENLNKLYNIYYPIIKVLRVEQGREIEYHYSDQMIMIEDGANNHSIKMPIGEFKEKSLQLLNKIKKTKGSSFTFEEIEEFLNSIKYESLKAGSKNKSDIRIVVHDFNTGMKPTLGFSIKSRLGRASTIFNASKSTNLIFKIIGNVAEEDIYEINNINTRTNKIRNRLKKIEEKGFLLQYDRISSEIFDLNLQVIDSRMPEILSELVFYYYSGYGSNVRELIGLIKEKNPLNFNSSFGHDFYEYKFKAFLRDVALGMTPSKKWDGYFDATGGYIVVKEDGEIVSYHIYNQNEFQQYLLNNTKFDSPSSTRHDYGTVYEVDGDYFFNLNFQIRFN